MTIHPDDLYSEIETPLYDPSAGWSTQDLIDWDDAGLPIPVRRCALSDHELAHAEASLRAAFSAFAALRRPGGLHLARVGDYEASRFVLTGDVCPPGDGCPTTSCALHGTDEGVRYHWVETLNGRPMGSCWSCDADVPLRRICTAPVRIDLSDDRATWLAIHHLAADASWMISRLDA